MKDYISAVGKSLVKIDVPLTLSANVAAANKALTAVFPVSGVFEREGSSAKLVNLQIFELTTGSLVKHKLKLALTKDTYTQSIGSAYDYPNNINNFLTIIDTTGGSYSDVTTTKSILEIALEKYLNAVSDSSALYGCVISNSAVNYSTASPTVVLRFWIEQD